jgi:hypothetical protein
MRETRRIADDGRVVDGRCCDGNVRVTVMYECVQEKNTWMIDCGCKQDKRIASKTLEYIIIFL